MTKPQPWSIELAQRLLKEAPFDMPLIEVFALALEAERGRAARLARSTTKAPAQRNSKSAWIEQIGETIAVSIEDDLE